MQLELLGQFDADPVRVEQIHDLGPVLQVRARAVPEREPRTAISEFEEFLDVVGILLRYRRARCPCQFFTDATDRKSTRLNSSHVSISYAVFCLNKKHIQLAYRPHPAA